MRYPRYTLAFIGAAVLLTLGAVGAYREISARALSARGDDPARAWPADTLVLPDTATVRSTDFGAIAAADERWRRENAKSYTLDELRVRGDGRRTPRQAMEDRVFALSRRGDRAAAIAELERWVAAHPRDQNALLSLARLLNEAGRSKDSVKRYRQALDLASGGGD